MLNRPVGRPRRVRLLLVATSVLTLAWIGSGLIIAAPGGPGVSQTAQGYVRAEGEQGAPVAVPGGGARAGLHCQRHARAGRSEAEPQVARETQRPGQGAGVS